MLNIETTIVLMGILTVLTLCVPVIAIGIKLRRDSKRPN